MSDNIDESKSQKRSDKCLKLLQDVVEAISLGVSFDEFNKVVCPNGGGKEIHGHFQNVFISHLRKSINNGFQQMNISEKMENLDKLAQETSEDAVAWRPVTGNVDISGMEKRGLSLRKLILTKKIESLDKDIENMKQEIRVKRQSIKETNANIEKLIT